MRKCTFIIFILLLYLASLSCLSQTPIIPQNIALSYQMELLANPAITEEDLRYLATGIIKLTQNISTHEATKKVNKLDIKKIKKIVTSEFPVECFEIPYDLFKKNERIIIESFIDSNKQLFTKDGEKFVRWFIHPLHDETYIRKHYIDYKVKNKFVGLMTSSRSMVVGNINTHEYWSIKSSITNAYGPFKEKIYRTMHAIFHYKMSKIIKDDDILSRSVLFDTSYIAGDNYTLFEGQVVRPLESITDGDYIFSLATLIDQDFGNKVAKKNKFPGSNIEFIKKFILPELGQITGRLYSKFGMIHHSLHSQNIVVRLDKNFQFKSVYIKDCGFSIDKKFYEKTYGKAALDEIATIPEYVKKTHIGLNLDFSIFNGLDSNKVNDKQALEYYNQTGYIFFEAFLKQVKKDRKRFDHSPNYFLDAAKAVSIGVMGQDQWGNEIRPEITWNKLLIEEILEYSFWPGDPRYKDKTIHKNPYKTGKLKETKKMIINYLENPYNKEIELVNEKQIFEAWNDLVTSFDDIDHIFNQHNDHAITKLVNIFRNNPSINYEHFVSKLINTHPKFINSSNSFMVIFGKYLGTKTWHNYFSKASNTSLMQLWSNKEATGLVELPLRSISYFLLYLNEKDFKKVEEEINQDIMTKFIVNPNDLSSAEHKIANALKVYYRLQKTRMNAECRDNVYSFFKKGE